MSLERRPDVNGFCHMDIGMNKLSWRHLCSHISRTRLTSLVLPAFYVGTALLMVACSSAPKLSSTSEANKANTDIAKSTSKAPPTKAPVLPKANSGKGGYYQDDGPSDNPPPNLESTVDPIPMIEPLARGANKPYVVFGKTYVPITDPNTPFKQRGLATWYGKKFHGQKTSSGELYNMFQVTAAHPTLPIPSYARLTNLENGKQIIVRINDRGPFHSSRIIDLSYTAALKLGYLEKGSSLIEVERLLPDDIERMAENRQNQPSASTATAASQVVSVATSVVASSQTVVDPALAQRVETARVTAAPTQPSATALDQWFNAQEQRQPEKAATINSSGSGNFYIQLGAYAIRANAELTLAHFKERLANRLPDFDIVQQGNLYRLITGPFKSRAEANELIAENRELGNAKALVIQR